MLAKESLSEFPIRCESSAALHHRMYPVYLACCFFVFDAMACLRVVFHYLAGAASSFDVYLEVDD